MRIHGNVPTSVDWQSDDLSMRHEIYEDSMGDSSGQVDLRHNLRQNTSTNDEMRHESQINFTGNDGEDGDSTKHRSKSREESNGTEPVELGTNSTDGNADGPSRNRTVNSRIEGGINFTLTYERLSTSIVKDGNKADVVSYETCDDGSCIQLCCPLGERLIKESCVAGEHDDRLSPNLHGYARSDLLRNEDTAHDGRVFRVVVYDPCQENGRYLLNPDDYPDDEYVLFNNGTLYRPYQNEFVRSYCLAVVHPVKYVVAVCFKNTSKTIAEERSLNSIPIYKPIGLVISLPFLLITFLVYSILPELGNIHGCTLRGYISTLFVAYMSLAVLQLTSTQLSKSVCIALGTACSNCTTRYSIRSKLQRT